MSYLDTLWMQQGQIQSYCRGRLVISPHSQAQGDWGDGFDCLYFSVKHIMAISFSVKHDFIFHVEHDYIFHVMWKVHVIFSTKCNSIQWHFNSIMNVRIDKGIMKWMNEIMNRCMNQTKRWRIKQTNTYQQTKFIDLLL